MDHSEKLFSQKQVKEAFLQLAAVDLTQPRDILFSKLAAENPQLADEVRLLLKASEAGNVIEQICGLNADPLLAEHGNLRRSISRRHGFCRRCGCRFNGEWQLSGSWLVVHERTRWHVDIITDKSSSELWNDTDF